MSARVESTELLGDDQMRRHLEKRDTVLFKGLGREWQNIEKQIERLGFGEAYLVSQVGSHCSSAKVSPSVN